MNNYTYTKIEEANVILRSDGASIPINESNADYQMYLESLDKSDK
jgi:hypothetical protein